MSVKYHFLRGLFAMGGRGAMQDRQQDWLRQPALRWRHRLLPPAPSRRAGQSGAVDRL